MMSLSKSKPSLTGSALKVSFIWTFYSIRKCSRMVLSKLLAHLRPRHIPDVPVVSALLEKLFDILDTFRWPFHHVHDRSLTLHSVESLSIISMRFVNLFEDDGGRYLFGLIFKEIVVRLHLLESWLRLLIVDGFIGDQVWLLFCFWDEVASLSALFGDGSFQDSEPSLIILSQPHKVLPLYPVHLTLLTPTPNWTTIQVSANTVFIANEGANTK